MYRITAKAPTTYQLNSLLAFGMGIKTVCNGSYWAEKEFDTKEQAQDYLKNCADIYNNEDPDGTDERLADMMEGIKNSNCLKLDAVTAYIKEIESDDSPENWIID